MGASTIALLVFGILAVNVSALQERKKSLSPSDLSHEDVYFLKLHLGYLMDARSNSMYTQKVTSMKITQVDRIAQGYEVEAIAELTFTTCKKNKPPKNCQLTKDGQECSVAMKVIRSQDDGRLQYKLGVFHCGSISTRTTEKNKLQRKTQ